MNKRKINGLSLFSGYGGIDLALGEYVRPLLYCDIEPFSQAILCSRMDEGSLDFAPIWNDVTTLNGSLFKGLVDIVYGGFPCQDISVAGKGAGLEGKRSGLFSEIIRICKEASPQFIFLENVPAIRTRGSIEVQEALASIGYDSRWGTLSAAEIGANHKRERWFCLATNPNNGGHRVEVQSLGELQIENSANTWGDGEAQSMAHPLLSGLERQRKPIGIQEKLTGINGFSSQVANANLSRQCGEANASKEENYERVGQDNGWSMPSPLDGSWWQIEPDVGRVADGVANRVDRIKALGNGVVPLQVKTAFQKLMGIIE